MDRADQHRADEFRSIVHTGKFYPDLPIHIHPTKSPYRTHPFLIAVCKSSKPKDMSRVSGGGVEGGEKVDKRQKWRDKAERADEFNADFTSPYPPICVQS